MQSVLRTHTLSLSLSFSLSLYIYIYIFIIVTITIVMLIIMPSLIPSCPQLLRDPRVWLVRVQTVLRTHTHSLIPSCPQYVWDPRVWLFLSTPFCDPRCWERNAIGRVKTSLGKLLEPKWYMASGLLINVYITVERR